MNAATCTAWHDWHWYAKGLGVDRAYELYMKGAKQNSGFAMFRPGNMHQKGIGVAQDDDEAIRWFRRAAEFGHEMAGQRLSKLLAD